MILKNLALVALIFSFSNVTNAKKLKTKDILQEVYTDFELGKYNEVIETLSKVEKKIEINEDRYKKLAGLVYYWQAMSYVKLSDFEMAEKYFIKSLAVDYRTQDIYYEYGQVLYVSSKYKRARIAFKKSVKAKYKVGVSLYYIAFISQELRDYKKAVSFYNMIEKLSVDERKDVLQAARMQTGDIFLKQIERQRDPFKGVEKYVIPQYKKALDYDKESALASEIKQKIENLQRKYELVLFKMRNGKPTSRPPHYLKANILYGSNSNVTSAPDTPSNSSVSSTEAAPIAGTYLQAGAFFRYSIYPSSAFSYAPELSASYTKYNEEELAGYSNYYYKAALKMNYEHLYKKRPATFYIDLDYTYNADDASEYGEFEFLNNTYGVTFSEEVQFWENNPSTFRIRYESVAAEVDTSSYGNISFSYEQVLLIKKITLFFYNNYAIKTFNDSSAETGNTNTLTNRVDAILPSFYSLFNPTIYLSNTNTNYIEDSDKGAPNLLTYGVNLNRPIGKNLYLTVDFSISAQSADKDESDEYDNQLLTFNIDYIY